MITNTHKDKAIYIVGGGSSLREFDFSKLDNKITIGCNRAAFETKTDYLAFFDVNFYTEYRKEIEEFPGKVFTNTNEHIILNREAIRCKEWVHSYNQKLSDTRLTPLGVSERFEDGIPAGNCGFFALNLAYLMGANPIYLLGIDMQFGYGGKHKWFYEGPDNNGGEKQYVHMKQQFNYGAVFFDRQGVKVFNCSPISKLKGYPRFNMEDIV